MPSGTHGNAGGGGGTHRTVVIRHDTPDGGWHYDWMIDRVGGREEPKAGAWDARELVTFRIMVRPGDPMVRAFDAERAPDHRAVYLTKEGDIGGDRGAVRRVGAGWCAIARLDDHALDAEMDFGGGVQRVVGRWMGTGGEGGIGEWRFAVMEPAGR